MKSCPKCNRTFPDEGQKFCTYDGGLLVSPQNFDPNVTMRATATDLPELSPGDYEKETSRDLPDPSATLVEAAQAPTIALPRNTAPTGRPITADFGPVSPAPPAQVPPPSETVTLSPAPLPTVKKKSKLPWIIAGLLVILLLGGGALAGVFFIIVKPRLEGLSTRRAPAEKPPAPVEDTNRNAGTETTPIAEPSKASTEMDSFVPPPNSVAFTSSKNNLDGKLADHFFDFSFYYPSSWQTDPKAGVPGATNFVKVERSLPPDFTQENFAVGWYTSEGTFTADLPSYPRRVEEFSSSLARVFPEYRKVSEGPTKINSLDAYEFRWVGLSKGTEKGDLQLWGRVVFLPTGIEGDKTGATLTMFATSLAPELSGVEDVGGKGEMPVILESFRVGKKK
jgi:hypothetical protein